MADGNAEGAPGPADPRVLARPSPPPRAIANQIKRQSAHSRLASPSSSPSHLPGGGGNVRVAVRCRPFNAREKQLGSPCVLRMADKTTTIVNPVTGDEKTFTFDYSFWSHDPSSTDPPFASQQDVFDSVGADVLENAWRGYNVCLFAYGQTGSGKSYSMVGGGDAATEGIVPKACREIFARLRENPKQKAQVEVTMIEIYNERVRDLLDVATNANPFETTETAGLKVRTHPTVGSYVEGLTPCAVRDYAEVEALMARGANARTVAATNMNAGSSRAHTIVELRVRRWENDGSEVSSRISLVDLAGSERSDAAGSSGTRLKEGAAINKSLSALGNCIAALAERSSGKASSTKQIPYRDSTLTLLLKDSLGGNSRTVMIAALSPAAVNYEETLSTLRYADRARHIVSSAVVNRKKQNLVTDNPLFDDSVRPQSAIPWADKLAHTRDQMSVDIDAARREHVAREVASVRDAAGGIAASGASGISAELQRDLESVILLANEANVLCAEFDVGVHFEPTLVDAQSAALQIRAADKKSQSRRGGKSDESRAAASRDHALEVAADVTWNDTGRRSTWTKDALARRLDEWREVFAQWNEGELFTGEAAQAVEASALAEASREMRKLGTAELLTEPLAYLLDTETSYPAIVGPDGERRGTLEVSAVPCDRAGTPLRESDAVDDPAELVGKPLHFLVKIKRATGLPRTAAQAGFIDRPTTADVNERPGTGQVTATLRVRYHCAGLGAGWGAVHATPPVPVVAVNESRGSAMFRGFRSATGGAGGSGSTMGGASATLSYERPHACPTVTAAILAELEGGKIVFDVYLQQDGGAGAEAASASAAAAALGRRRRMAREIEPPSLVTGRNRAFDGGGDDDDDRAVGVLSEELCEGPGLGVGTGREGDEGSGSGESVLSSGEEEEDEEEEEYGEGEYTEGEYTEEEYRDDGEYSDGGTFYPYDEDPYRESFDDDAYADEGDDWRRHKGIINAAFRRMFRKLRKGTADSPKVTPAQSPEAANTKPSAVEERAAGSATEVEEGVRGVKLFDGDATVDTRSPADSVPASPREGSANGSGRASPSPSASSPSFVSPSRVMLSPLGKNRVEPTNVVDVRRNDREGRRKKEKKEKKDRERDRETRRQPRDFGDGGGGAAVAASATGADPRIYESTPEPIRQPAPRPAPTIFGGGHPALGGGTIPAKRDWYRELHAAEDTPEAERRDRA